MKRNIILFTLSTMLLIGCSSGGNNSKALSNNDSNIIIDDSYKFFEQDIVEKEISKEEYFNKTLGGLLGQFAGFLSGYEFVYRGAEPYVGMPKDWFEFLNGPYAGNFKYYTPGGLRDCYDRLLVNSSTGKNEVWSDDDYHIDIFNQTIINELGYSSYAIKETWKNYVVGDWGGGVDAMNLINKNDLLAPYTGTIEAGNRYGWCTEAYIENETLGMNAPGMPNTATYLVDKFASNVGYFDSVIWAKFYSAMYSLAYFETDVKVVMEKAKEILPKYSYPRQIYDYSFEVYNKYPNDYQKAAQEIVEKRRMLYRIDNIQCDPNINGAFAVLSWLYGNNSYLDTCMYASIMGYDGDCTAAITQGVMGILKGFKEGNEEYQDLNSKIYYDGEGVYYNDKNSGFPPHIKSDEYPDRQKIDDIVKLYQSNFEKILLENGGQIKDDSYVIPTTEVYTDHSYLFENCDAEERNTNNFEKKNGDLSCLIETDNENSHTGYACFKFDNTKKGRVYHEFNNLIPGRYYRFTAYAKTSENTQVIMYAEDDKGSTEITFANISSIINKELIFKATSQNMEVGFKFDEKQSNNAYVIFDDYYLEEVERELLFDSNDSNLKLSSNKYLKTIKKPEQVKAGEEVILSFEVRNYSGSVVFANLLRNNKVYGGVVVSNSSNNSLSGSYYLEIPYVFENSSDAVQLNFDGKLNIGNLRIYNNTQYMFR